MTQPKHLSGQKAVVIGGSMVGLLAARVLSDCQNGFNGSKSL
ncbi:MAG TPA: hypothetical protein VEC96_16315 [Anaerolineae bacterium]|nr:hypothetical protein [Anaerolineae bacterium]